jgi:hypothetical protein
MPDTNPIEPTASERDAALQKLASLSVELKESPTHEGDDFRTVRIAEMERLSRIAYAPEKPAAPTGPSRSERIAAHAESREIVRTLLNDLPEGDPLRPLYTDRLLELTEITDHEKLAAARTPASPADLAHPNARHAPWLPELIRLGQNTGLDWAPFTHLVENEKAGGRRGTSDAQCREELYRKHGPERGEEICQAAITAAYSLPRGLRSELEHHNLLANPTLVEDLGRRWLRRQPSGAR